MQTKIDELWLQTSIVVGFFRSYKDILSIERLLYYKRVMDPNTHHNLFQVWHFVHAYTCNSKTTGGIVLHIKQLL